MKQFSPLRHPRRYHEIVSAFVQHGFGFVFDRLALDGDRRPRHVRGEPDDGQREASQDLAVHFRQALEELGPTFVKLGQVLSTRPDVLPPAYIVELSKLQDTVPPAPWEEIRQVLVEEYGRDPEDVFAEIDPQPLGAASLAQVHAVTLRDGRKAVVKIQRPHILPTIEADLDILMVLARAAQHTPKAQMNDFVAMAEDFGFTLHNELDYRREGKNADRFRTNFMHESHLHIPRVHWEYTTGRVLVMERISGIKIDDIAALDTAGFDRHQLVVHCADIIVKEVLEDGFFHADPHPGNLVVLPSGVIAAMDFGMVGCLTESLKSALIRLCYAVTRQDPQAILDELIRMGAAGPEVDRDALKQDIGRMLTKYYGRQLRDLTARELTEDIRPIAYRHHLCLPNDFWLLAKTLTMMEGLGLRLDPGFDMFSYLQPVAERMMWQMMLPRHVTAQDFLYHSADWVDLLTALPRAANRLLRRADKGDLLQIGLEHAGPMMNQLDRVATRLSLSIIVAALILSLAQLVPPALVASSMQWPVTVGFAAAIGLGLWLLISMLRGTR